MIRYLRYALLAVLAISLLTVALANRAPVTLKALPDDLAAFSGLGWQIELPLYLVIFASILVGVLIGFVWEWFREHKHRALASTKTREVSKLERELAVMRDTKPEPQDDVLALLDQRKAG
ncbi:lipopolysaccharide assembly protein LapA domain-containing protein [Pseudotabrizicola algicola]|uniref:lipopolysaccharide assembly protein LapA domain-containing protein n=1 Tax=Pseudotabrizicola algicola TaxID=2709381 RepID=UPI0019677872|nr:LapA family protein [Pseudotabrizicola algicola]